MRNFFRSGAAWNGGVHHRHRRLNPAHPASRGWNFSCGPATPRIPARNGLVGSGRTRNPAPAWKLPPPASRNGKRSFTTGRPGDGIEWVSLAYLPRNVAPVIDGIAIQDASVRVQSANAIQTGQPVSVTLKTPPAPNPTGVIISQSASQKFEQPPQGFVQKGYQSVLWSAHDDNDDDLRFSVFYRGENEKEWKLLKDKLDQKFYSWDATTLPDGAYYLRIVANDSPSNPPAVTLSTTRDSERFVIDNTPPVIDHLEATTVAFRSASAPASQSEVVKFAARDATSSIDRAQYSLDGGDWILVAPVGNISDALEERYEFAISEGLTPGEHTIAVRAYDHFDNMGSAKSTINVPAAKP
jgi:hypothetical protein